MDWIASFVVQGGTAPEASLLSALRLRPEVIYLLTDGVFEESIVDSITKKNKGTAAIHTIGFDNYGGESLLQSIARQNNGQYRFVK